MKKQNKTLLKTLSMAALLAINSYAYQAGTGASDNGTASNTAVGQAAEATGAYSATATGANSNASAAEATVLGAQSSASGVASTVLGAQSNATGDYSTAIGAYSNALANNSVAIGTGARANESGVVSFGRGIENGDVSNSFARLVNIADPINAHDAVNLNYLTTTLTSYYTKAQVDTLLTNAISSAATYTDTAVGGITSGASSSYVDSQDAATLQQSKSYTDQQIAETKKEAAKGTALAIALGTPLDYSNGSNAMAIGTGYYKGEKAISIMGGKRLNNGISYTAGFASAGSGEHAFKAGVGFSW